MAQERIAFKSRSGLRLREVPLCYETHNVVGNTNVASVPFSLNRDGRNGACDAGVRADEIRDRLANGENSLDSSELFTIGRVLFWMRAGGAPRLLEDAGKHQGRAIRPYLVASILAAWRIALIIAGGNRNAMDWRHDRVTGHWLARHRS
jgi:hypothetical protein